MHYKDGRNATSSFEGTKKFFMKLREICLDCSYYPEASKIILVVLRNQANYECNRLIFTIDYRHCCLWIFIGEKDLEQE